MVEVRNKLDRSYFLWLVFFGAIAGIGLGYLSLGYQPADERPTVYYSRDINGYAELCRVEVPKNPNQPQLSDCDPMN